MSFRALPHVLASFVLAANLVWATGCGDDDEDDCVHCCTCSNDNDPRVYRLVGTTSCMTCAEQCQALADRELMGQEFDHVNDVSCDD